MKPIVVLTTVGADFDARALAHALVETRVAACVNILPVMHSVYRWEGRVTGDDEQLLVMKTTDARVEELRDELFKRHPYEVPEFVVLAVESVSEAYGAWVLESVGAPA
ncbi:MAG: divalent-cation tolerance protein CutA, partial [Thermoanaerobaculia bacterium]